MRIASIIVCSETSLCHTHSSLQLLIRVPQRHICRTQEGVETNCISSSSIVDKLTWTSRCGSSTRGTSLALDSHLRTFMSTAWDHGVLVIGVIDDLRRLTIAISVCLCRTSSTQKQIHVIWLLSNAVAPRGVLSSCLILAFTPPRTPLQRWSEVTS